MKKESKTKKTVCCMIIDKSGSMMDIKEDLRGSINDTIGQMKSLDQRADQKVKMEVRFFNGTLTTQVPMKKVAKVQLLTEADYQVEGLTALYDAIGQSLQYLEKQYAQDADVHVNVSVYTDGFENDSRHFSLGQVKKLIARAQERNNWTFAFIGCAEDTLMSAQAMGIRRDRTVFAERNKMKKAMQGMASALEDRMLYDKDTLASRMQGIDKG